MDSKLANLPKEKRQKIIDVCIEEFAQYGYKNTSTNNIVKKAEISKGLLFHYFGSKKSLYLTVLDYVTVHVTEVIYQRMTNLPADFFERTIKIGMIKLQTAYEYPREYKFLLEAFTHVADDLKQEVQTRYEKMYQDSLPILFKDIDTSKFRQNIDKQKAIELINLALEGISNKYIKLCQSKTVDESMAEMEDVTQEYYAYVEILKNGVYGQGQPT